MFDSCKAEVDRHLTKVFLERKGLSEDKIHQLPRHPVAVYFKSPRAARRSQRCQSPFPVDKDGASGPLWRSPCLSAGATDYGAILKPNPRFVTPLFFFRLLLFVTIGWRPFWNAGVRVAAFIMINLSDGPRTFSLSLSRSIFLCYSTRRLARAFLPPVVQWSLSHKACRECDSIGIKRFRRLVRIRSDTAVSSTQTLSASSHCTGEPSRSPHFWGQS